MASKTSQRATAIVGIGNTDFPGQYHQKIVELTSYDFAVGALKAALDDSGLSRDDIDGLICVRVPSYERVATMLGLRHPRLVNLYEGTGRMSGVALQSAVAAVATGAAEVVACVYGNDGRSVGAKYGGTRNDPRAERTTAIYDEMYGMTSPGASVALMYRRYQHLYGVPDDALAPIAINNRTNASLNSNAVMRDPLTRETYMASRFIAEPLRLYDYCLINDGGVAFIVTSAERARDLKKPPVYVKATAASSDLTNYYASDDFFYQGGQAVATELFEQSGVARQDVDCLQIYDNFTPIVLFSLEAFGYAPRGEAWEWIDGGDRIGLQGSMPINTSGGHTSESYMQGWALHTESVRQLRGEAGERQIKDCATVQYMCLSPIVTSHILSRDL